MNRPLTFLTGLVVLMLTAGRACAQAPVEVSLDPVVNWRNQDKVTLEQFKKAYENVKNAEGEVPYEHVLSSAPYTPPESYVFSTRSKTGRAGLSLSLLGGRIAVERAEFVWGVRGAFSHMRATLEPGLNGAKIYQAKADLLKLLGTSPSFSADVRDRTGGRSTRQSWKTPEVEISFSIYVREKFMTGRLLITSLVMAQPGAAAAAPGSAPAVVQQSAVTDFDKLLNFSEVWSLTPDDFEKAFTDPGATAPKFDWVTTERDRARFFGRAISNTAPSQLRSGQTGYVYKTNLSLMGGTVPVEKADIEFQDGRVARITFTLYSLDGGSASRMRGSINGSQIREFVEIVGKVEKGLSPLLKVTPFGQRVASDETGNAVAEVWSSPLVTARLEHSGYPTKRDDQMMGLAPNYLRLTLSGPHSVDGRTGFDKYMDWNGPLAVKPGMLEKIGSDFSGAGHPQTVETTAAQPGGSGTSVELHPVYSVLAQGTFTALEDRFSVRMCRINYQGDRVTGCAVGLVWMGPEKGTSSRMELIRILTEWYGSDPSSESLITLNNGFSTERVSWKRPDCKISVYRSAADSKVVIFSADALDAPFVATTVPEISGIAANLDRLLDFSSVWGVTPDAFEKLYHARSSAKDDPVPPQFEWLSAEKERARFSRKMVMDLETPLKMFGGAVTAEEAIVEFVDGRAARATVSFYNRGDSDDVTVEEFDAIFKKVGQSLGVATKVSPRSQLISSNAAVKTIGWNWTTPQGIAILEYNDYKGTGGEAKPEFLRLKLASPTQADWSMGKLNVGVQRMALVKNVKQGAGGDIYVSGVPMVDQGAKGYCVAASCQRLFEYMHIPCDQHEMAQLLDMDAEKGVNPIQMHISLAKVDGKFEVTFKPFVNPGLYPERIRARSVSPKEFTGIIKEYADKGIPLLWALQLGQFPEDPPAPGGGQVSGGHMRMIIGYNAEKKQILFTDSWGAGHELKRMSLGDAYEATLGLYSMAPRGM